MKQKMMKQYMDKYMDKWTKQMYITEYNNIMCSWKNL